MSRSQGLNSYYGVSGLYNVYNSESSLLGSRVIGFGFRVYRVLRVYRVWG